MRVYQWTGLKPGSAPDTCATRYYTKINTSVDINTVSKISIRPILSNMLHIVAFTVNLCVHRKPSKHDIVDLYTTTSHHIKKNPNLCHVYNGRAMFVDSVYSDVQSLMMHATWRSSRQLFIPRIH